jgi:6-pyruvoyltetrahydropterin/6-carboxytetrahydropterin synthase
MKITKEYSWEMAHLLLNHKGRCKNIHGHSYKAIFEIDSWVTRDAGASYDGMVIDYGDLTEFAEVIDNLDHCFMVHEATEEQANFREVYEKLRLDSNRLLIVGFNPTAENIAEYIYNKVSKNINNTLFTLKVTVKETAGTSAIYEQDAGKSF